MALNPNHTFEDLGEVKCSVVEKNCTPDRRDFLEALLKHNGFTVVVVKSPPPKAAAKPAAPAAPVAEGEAPPVVPPAPAEPLPPDTFTVGVADLTFSVVNAVFNRELVTQKGAVVTIAYWKQQEAEPKVEEWYWAK